MVNHLNDALARTSPKEIAIPVPIATTTSATTTGLNKTMVLAVVINFAKQDVVTVKIGRLTNLQDETIPAVTDPGHHTATSVVSNLGIRPIDVLQVQYAITSRPVSTVVKMHHT